MSNFPNAAPPPGALFDNAPTVPPVRELSRDYVDGVVAIWANGRTQCGRCRSDKVQTAQDARTALVRGASCVFVMAGDVEVVRGAQGND